MFVFRVQNSEGHGPYTAPNVNLRGVEWDVPHDECYGRPTPTLTVSAWETFGFQDVLNVQEWFTRSERRWLEKKGFYIQVYSVADEFVRILNRQCVFDKDKAEKHSRMALPQGKRRGEYADYDD